MGAVTVSFRNRVPQRRRELRAHVERVIRKAALDIEAQAKARAPVDTGFLRNSINASGAGPEWRVDSPAEYSVYVEFGTSRMPARPYLTPALEFVRPSLVAALKRTGW